MATDLRTRATKEELLDNARLSYAPVVLALNNKRQHALDVETVVFKEIKLDEASVVAELLNREQTEYAHIKAYTDKSKFNVFARGAKFIHNIDANINLQALYDKVIRLYSIAFDRDGLLGDGGNNGLLQSANDNYVTNASITIPAAAGSGFNQVSAFVALMTSLKLQIDATTASNDLLIYTYGNNLQQAMGQITEGTNATLTSILRNAMPSKRTTWIDIPAVALGNSASTIGNGFVVVSNDVTTLDYTIEPTVRGDGVNEENGYYWANFARGSLQITPDVIGGVIKQPLVFA